MSEITEKLSALLSHNAGAPFLFVGSGFSRRYIGLEQWSELLSRFCSDIRDFGYYSSRNNNDLAKAASDISRDFNEMWWRSEKFSTSREENKGGISNESSALKLEISRYLMQIVRDTVATPHLADELDVLPRLNVDGIITTNWDLFLEELFPDYKVFIGQEELLFSNPQSIAEIYKIHGCASQPNSLILTQEDYDDFDAKNAYLAAKLITIFIEHPVVFIGYSLSDRNIQSLIKSIIKCLSKDKVETFGRNLVFLQRAKVDEPDGFSPAVMAVGEMHLNVTVIRTNDFLEVYKAIEVTKRKIPARILRYCKEQMYDLVKVAEPSNKLAVVDIDQIEDKEDVEFVVGVGLAEVQDRLSRRGYQAIGLDDIFQDLLEEKSVYDADELLGGVYPTLFRRPNKYIPAYRYLRQAGINSLAELRASKHAVVEKLLEKSKGTKSAQYKTQYDRQFKGLGTQQIIESTTPEKAPIMIEHQDEASIDVDAIENFLRAHRDKFTSSATPYYSWFRRLACLYDRLKYGF